MAIRDIGENAWILEDSQAIVVREAKDSDTSWDEGDIRSIQKTGDYAHRKIKEWGKDNRQPTNREELIAQNNIVGELIKTKRDITLGGGLVAYQERFDEGKIIKDFIPMPSEMEEVFEQVNVNKYLRVAMKNLLMHANVFTEFIRQKGDANRIVSIKALESRHVRAEEQNKRGLIENYYWCGAWNPEKYEKGQNDVTQIPNWMKDAGQKKFLLHTGDDILSDEYYFIPTWWGGRSWIELANIIPHFHASNLQHGYTIRYHIEIPKDYFKDHNRHQLTPDKLKQAQEKESEAKQAFLNKLNDFLAGLKNTGRAVITEYEINRAAGKDFPGIKIQPLEVDLQDEALLKLFEKSNQANISAQGIHPTLANIETQGKLSSGSEIRNAFLMYLAIKTPVIRQIALEPIYLMARENGWDRSIKLGFQDIELTRLDEEPTGNQNVSAA